MPDVKVKAPEALKAAHVAAVNALIAKATDPERKASLALAREMAKNPPVKS